MNGMKAEGCKRPSLVQIRKESVRILAQKGNRLLLIQAWMLLLLSACLCGMLYTSIGLLAGILEVWMPLQWLLPWLAGIPFCLFLVLPLFVGVMGLACAMSEGREALLADVFAPFSSGRQYRRALRISFSILWRFCGLLLLSALTWKGMLLVGDGSPIYEWIGGFLVFAEWTVGLLLVARVFPLLAISYLLPKASVREARRMTATFPSSVYHGTVFCIGQLPSFLLGLLTVGILLLADWLPRVSVSYIRYCKTVFESMIRLEENRNE